jgi:acyl carrier protein
MTAKEKKVIFIFKKVFKKKDININSNIGNIKNWDSVNHMNLILELEKTFKVKINFEKQITFKSLKDVLKFLN